MTLNLTEKGMMDDGHKNLSSDDINANVQILNLFCGRQIEKGLPVECYHS